MSKNISAMKYAKKSVPGLADVGALHEDGDGPRTLPRCVKGSIEIKMTYLTMPNNISPMKYALIQSLALLMLGCPMGTGITPGLHPDFWMGHEKVSND